MVNAKEFSEEWISAWNSQEIDKIMKHYAEDIEFYSPVIQNLGVNQEGVLKNKTELRSYFEKALALYPDLFFDLHEVLSGTNSVICITQASIKKSRPSSCSLMRQEK
ncbi:nuclear transport factor 2 family protein [Dyadobacter sp. LHD-138]|uniref:nuclear transport factor 2 family protein n=1 Tax=Dyadobacter sp. LHD-138 TaxID=3071413 RepID=UPI0027E13755|nr:nuclear transport factor 2 family protein [Dyadobacter sp. LHD-138]MDQ6481423.1 nuclear transport factor 2 family protein [Dyadobacter sp. LHD-138]